MIPCFTMYMNWFNLYVNTWSTVKFLCIQHEVTQSMNSSEGIQNIVKLLQCYYRSLNFIEKKPIFQTRYKYFKHVVPSKLCFRSQKDDFTNMHRFKGLFTIPISQIVTTQFIYDTWFLFYFCFANFILTEVKNYFQFF